VPSSAADEETAIIGVRLAALHPEVKNLRSKMQAEAIDMTRFTFTFLSLVGTAD
jgi:hypothetical protein